MGIRNPNKETADRLNSKTLDERFRVEITCGLNCSPFEAEAVLQVVKEVYCPLLDQAASQVPPGKISLIAVDADEPAGKSVRDCQKRTVCLTLHRGAEGDRLLMQGPAAFRQARIPDLCQQAFSQAALLTVEDLAFRVFFVSTRTISPRLHASLNSNKNRCSQGRSLSCCDVECRSCDVTWNSLNSVLMTTTWPTTCKNSCGLGTVGGEKQSRPGDSADGK